MNQALRKSGGWSSGLPVVISYGYWSNERVELDRKKCEPGSVDPEALKHKSVIGEVIETLD